MEPDPPKNLERSGSSKRRISSILKVPRKSAKSSDLEQQENVVERVKPVEKRNSRRVSFAPADDVLLFSKDVKNTSSSPNHFQELLTGPEGPMQNRQVAVTEDGSQQIIGIKNLLNAPLHDHPQREKDDFTQGAFGEKTVMFSQHDAFMDMTHSTSINIVADVPGDNTFQSYDLPTDGDKRVMFPLDPLSTNKTPNNPVRATGSSISLFTGRNLDPCIEKKKASASQPCLDLKFEDLLANILKPSGTSATVTKVMPPAGQPSEERNCFLPPIKTQQVNFDNKIEAPTSALMGKSLNTSRKSGDLTAALWPQDSLAMIMTEVQTGLLPRADDDPFQGLFPSQDMYADLDKASSKTVQDMMTPQQQSTNAMALNTTEGLETSFKSAFNTKIQTQQVECDAYVDCKEKTIRFTADDACMDFTQCQTVNIGHDLELPSLQHNEYLPASGEKTVRFSADASSPADAGEDVTRGNTLNTVTNFPSSSQNIVIPTWEEKQTEPTANDDCMEMTRCLTVNIDKNTATYSSPKHLHSASIQENVAFPSVMKEAEDQTCGLLKERSSRARHFDGETSEEEDPHTSFPQKTIGPSNFLLPIRTRKPENNTETEDPKQASAVMERSAYQGMADINASMDLTEAHKSCILGQTSADKTSPIQKSHLQPLKTTEKSLKRRSDGPADSEVEIKKLPDSHEANTAEATRETEQVGLTCPLTQEMESFALEQDPDIVRSQKSRRKSLADLQSKLRRLSHVINAEPDPTDLGSCTAPQFDPVNNSSDKTTLLVEEPEPQIEVDPQDQCLTTSQPPLASVATTPFTVRTSQLVSRLSVGCFQPKLPQRSQTVDVKKVNSTGDPTKTVRALSHLSSFDHDVSDIYDEELGSLEDVSETLITGSPQQIIEQDRSQESEFKDIPLENDVFEAAGAVQNQERPFPDDENMLNETRIKASTETVQMSGVAQNDVDGTPPMTTRTIDSSSSHTTSMRGEATFESTSKQSLFESQLEDFTSDLQMKLEDGTITVSEFFKLFNIDFVIHTPRLSVCPGRLMPDSEVTPLDLLKARHVSHPKQMVYEADVRALTEKVDRLKVRMGDLDRPLRSVNAPLWEEMKHSSEKELKSFGVKLKERNNFFRKTSKVQSDEMKEVLYSSLVHANLEEQQKLKGTIQKADEMIKSLDDCLSNLEAELAAVEETDSENKPSLRSLQQEMKKVTETFADNERQVSNLEMQKHQDSSRLTRLKAETERMESHLDMLSQLSEWKLKDRTDELTVFTFLYETMDLQLMYEKSNVADCSSERKVARISFEFLLDEEGSQSHTRLVHKLVSQHINGESAWEEKYPTSQYVPKLLHDVSLVVSRCRLLGEECRRLRMWGSLPFDILNVSCHDSKVGIVFSCLEKFAKFEVVFAISLVNRLYVVQLESFKNKIGSVTMEQIEEIVASFTPGKNLLTKIVKNIHETLLT